jgi:hypothetical protein
MDSHTSRFRQVAQLFIGWLGAVYITEKKLTVSEKFDRRFKNKDEDFILN